MLAIGKMTERYLLPTMLNARNTSSLQFSMEWLSFETVDSRVSNRSQSVWCVHIACLSNTYRKEKLGSGIPWW